MVYTVTQAISEAYYTSTVVAREFQVVSGSQIQDGLNLLNQILTDKTVELDKIMYWTRLESVLIPGQEAYFFPGLIDVRTVTFFIPNAPTAVRYKMRRADADEYWGQPRVNNIMSLPFMYMLERQMGINPATPLLPAVPGANLYFYFLPDQAYPIEIWGKFTPSLVSLNQDLSLSFDLFYISYLQYRLCEKICLRYGYSVPDNVVEEIARYDEWISNQSAKLDLTQTKNTTLDGTGSDINYAQANIGKGWIP